jgi:hypothetical protein
MDRLSITILAWTMASRLAGMVWGTHTVHVEDRRVRYARLGPANSSQSLKPASATD